MIFELFFLPRLSIEARSMLMIKWSVGSSESKFRSNFSKTSSSVVFPPKFGTSSLCKMRPCELEKVIDARKWI